MNEAIGPCRADMTGGNLMISGSANKLYRNPWTSSSFSGPPKFRSITPILLFFFPGDCGEERASLFSKVAVILIVDMAGDCAFILSTIF
mmetsp:Transcript_22961/g.51957  ORF Transcript_22961/g.51957 Transcript_22961/m.51957 type:complete len:89 (+) Transcript_22961:1268-1534(+)